MHSLKLESKPSEKLIVLCLGAHCDDIEIGCGGTILQLLKNNPNAEIHWYVFSSNEVREKEARLSASKFLSESKYSNIKILNFRNGYFPYVGAEIKDYFEKIKQQINPDIIFTHFRGDLHQDHKTLGELTWNTFRDHLIFEYEIPKYDGDMGSPNVFVTINNEECIKKSEYIYDSFISQRDKHWFTKDTILSIMRLRGVEAASPTAFAEAFFSKKTTIEF